MRGASQLVDPVEAYDRLARIFDGIAARRSRYLRGIEDLVVARVAPGASALLDVGAGDGSRARRIADAAGLRRVVLVEPSVEMAGRAGQAEVWLLRAEELTAEDPRVADRRFDLVTCLWNVLGHVRPEAARVASLRQMGAVLAPEGRLFVDVNHRYNVPSYGALPTLARFVLDSLSPAENRGDVTVTWTVGETTCSTYGHVFTDREMRRLAAHAGLVLQERIVVDYDTGQTRRWTWQGNLLYVLRRASP